jgi:hypothetical protein
MMTATRSARSMTRARFTDSGLVPVRKADVKAGHGYYLGASSSPSFVLVLAATDDAVRYCDSYSLAVQTQPRWIFEDLTVSAHETVKRDAASYAKAAETANESTAGGRLTKQCARVAAERLAAHGAAVVFSDYNRVECRVKGSATVDASRVGKDYGVVGDWDSEANEVTVECSEEDVCRMLGAGVTLGPLRVIKACPTA